MVKLKEITNRYISLLEGWHAFRERLIKISDIAVLKPVDPLLFILMYDSGNELSYAMERAYCTINIPKHKDYIGLVIDAENKLQEYNEKLDEHMKLLDKSS